MPISGQSSLTGVQSGMNAPCDISLILSFLQELRDKGCTPFMLKVYMAAITANHTLMAGQSVGRNKLMTQFLKGA